MIKKTSRRKFINQSGVLLGTTFLSGTLLGRGLSDFQLSGNKNKIGSWSYSKNGLPVFEYIGQLPFVAFDKDGKDADQPEDPFFLLGNYRMTLITHASGIFQLLSAERVWARINASEQTNYGYNDASIVFESDQTKQRADLIGLQSLASDNSRVKKSFGAGFAKYAYQLNNQVTCTRIISVKPSDKINTGSPGFVVMILLKNNGNKEQKLAYTERMGLNFVLNGTQYTQPEKRPFIYRPKTFVHNIQKLAIANIEPIANDFFVLPGPAERFQYEVAPPKVFMHAQTIIGTNDIKVHDDKNLLATTVHTSVKPNETVSFQIVIGLTMNGELSNVQAQIAGLLAGAEINNPLEGLFSGQWKQVLPDFSTEKDDILKREMLWNAHFIEASAKYNDYYKETFIPQGTVYSYYYGDNISNRDHLQAALPACYTNPPLAKSIIKYVIKHTELDGEIKRGNSGYGYTAPSLFKESDEQLFFFNTLAEYLLITKDFAFLNEQGTYYPSEKGIKDDVLTVIKKHFIYLRDEIGLGANGLVKMLNSDWSDSFFHDYSPNRYGYGAESHLNSAMVLAIFPKLITALQNSGNVKALSFIDALKNYYSTVEKNYLKDLGNRKFSARAYLSSKLKFGLDIVCLEPQGYLLQSNSLTKERKKEIYEYVKSKVLIPEKIGIRTREKPLWGHNPDGEDGGIWFSLEYPVLLGVATFDKEEAWRLLQKFSFQNFTDNYPDYWVGQWTAADEVNSTLYREGLYAFWVPSQDRKRAFQGFCSHPHTWPLFCYYKLKE